MRKQNLPFITLDITHLACSPYCTTSHPVSEMYPTSRGWYTSGCETTKYGKFSLKARYSRIPPPLLRSCALCSPLGWRYGDDMVIWRYGGEMAVTWRYCDTPANGSILSRFGPELVRLQLREPCWWSRGHPIELSFRWMLKSASLVVISICFWRPKHHHFTYTFRIHATVFFFLVPGLRRSFSMKRTAYVRHS